MSCSNYEHGYFSGYRHLADENPEFVLCLGDYIYDYIEERRPIVRRHSDGIEAATLPTYRNRYAQYRLAQDLQRLHAEVPVLVTWDDHEVQNDYADKWSQYFDDPERFLIRRAAAYRAVLRAHAGTTDPVAARRALHTDRSPTGSADVIGWHVSNLKI
ncbi:MAG: alkaline phosphatase D family protein [Roseiarcus sp.]